MERTLDGGRNDPFPLVNWRSVLHRCGPWSEIESKPAERN